MRQLSRILYVDDEPDIQTVATMALELDGSFEVRSCGSGAEAMKLIESFRPDLVMLDVMMPGMDGPSTLSAIRALPGGRALPVIFITAKAQRQEIERFRALGAIDVISKPFDPMTLAGTVRRIWQMHERS